VRRPAQAWRRYRVPIAFAGAAICIGQLAYWFSLGAWPLHDTAEYWLAGVHFREGQPVYAGDVNFLTMLYAPPWVVVMGVVSLVPLMAFEVGLLAAQVLALRYVAGSWLVAAALGWLPFVPRELATGNVDLLIAAAMLATARRGPAWPTSFFTFAKFTPVLTLAAPGARRLEAVASGLVLLAITLPWLHLWPEWLDVMRRAQQQVVVEVPLLPRLVVALPLLAYRRPWSVAAAAATAIPGFYFHTPVLYLAAARLLWDDRRTETAIARHRVELLARVLRHRTGALKRTEPPSSR
jgi:hypothetical protein